jgi:hypothetical protein
MKTVDSAAPMEIAPAAVILAKTTIPMMRIAFMMAQREAMAGE